MTTTGQFFRSTAVPSLEHRRSCRENTCYRPHTHDVLSLGLIEEGTSVLAGPLSGPVALSPGDVIVIPSGHVHSCNPDAGRWEYQMTHLDPAWADEVMQGVSRTTGVCVLRSTEVYDQLTTVNDAIVADCSAAELAGGFRRLDTVIGTAASDETVTAVEVPDGHGVSPDMAEKLQPVLRRLRFDDMTPGLDELAEMAGMSRFQLDRAVKKMTGLSPVAWRQNARILEARRMLRSGAAIADTAYALGFTDQSHFHRVFRAHVATTPGDYRASFRE